MNSTAWLDERVETPSERLPEIGLEGVALLLGKARRPGPSAPTKRQAKRFAAVDWTPERVALVQSYENLAKKLARHQRALSGNSVPLDELEGEAQLALKNAALHYDQNVLTRKGERGCFLNYAALVITNALGLFRRRWQNRIKLWGKGRDRRTREEVPWHPWGEFEQKRYPDPVEGVENSLFFEELRERLDPQLREVFDFRLRGLASKEIAKRLGCSKRTIDRRVGALVARAREVLGEGEFAHA